MSAFKVGVVTHYYDKIGVAVVELTAPLAVGDTVRFMRGGEELFEEKIESMQLDHGKVTTASAGDVIGLKTTQDVKSSAEVFKIEN